MIDSRSALKVSFSLTVCLFLAAVSSDAQARRAKPLVDPPKTSWGCELSEKQVKKGIAEGMISLTWKPQFNEDNEVFGVVNVRGKHTLRVNVTYDTSSFDIDYASSDNLKYKEKDGKPYLHPNGNSWMDNLNNAISTNLALMCE